MPHPTEVACLNRTGLSRTSPSRIPGLEAAYAVCSRHPFRFPAFRFGALLNNIRTLDRRASAFFTPSNPGAPSGRRSPARSLPAKPVPCCIFEAGDGAFLGLRPCVRAQDLSAPNPATFMELSQGFPARRP